ncbi:hypothetical protein XarbCFBP7614_09255 [Xanthomonas arboricola]|nr:hypothetical protein XarbCFBP7614_09255 [Xanthomonas arboricola]
MLSQSKTRCQRVSRWPRKSLHGRTCGVSCDGGRARALQPNRSPPLYCRPGRAHRHPKTRPRNNVKTAGFQIAASFSRRGQKNG